MRAELYPNTELNTFEDINYKRFDRGLLHAPGSHLLCVGATGSGKSCKAYIISKWCMDAGKYVAWFDSGKPEDLEYILDFAKEITIHTPPGCKIDITGSASNIRFKQIGDPATLFRSLESGYNFISIKPFFDDTPPYMDYLAKVMHGLINDSFRKKIKAKPIQIFFDEFQDICPSTRLQHVRAQKRLGSRISQALFKLRSIGVGFCAFTQSIGNVLPAIRLQFNYFLICRDPGGDYIDHIGKRLLQYSPMFSKFEPEDSVIIYRRTWGEKIKWPMPKREVGVLIDWDGVFNNSPIESPPSLHHSES